MEDPIADVDVDVEMTFTPLLLEDLTSVGPAATTEVLLPALVVLILDVALAVALEADPLPLALTVV